MRKTENFKIEYYSGTGCTALAAESLYAALTGAGQTGSVHRLAVGQEEIPASQAQPALYILMFPVHSFNAPEAVYKHLESLTAAGGTPAAVIDVSGGGEICPNRAVRVSSIKRFEKKGYDVFYEDSIVMPSNCVVPTNEQVSVRLLEALPEKTKQIAENILSGVRRRPKPNIIDRLASRIGEIEKPAAKSFGKSLAATDECDGCGWCAENCPAGNISMKAAEAAEEAGPGSTKPLFDINCHFCMGCVYGCPRNALVSKKYGFAVIKEGFSIDRLKKMAQTEERSDADLDSLLKGYLWSGVKKYLKDLK